MHQKLNFISVNEGFKCLNCGEKNPPADKTCRNHCRKCLWSLHVDKTLPGDRESDCLGLMEPISLDQNGRKGFIIFHKCQKCGKMIPNKVASDDNQEEIIKLSYQPLPAPCQETNINHRKKKPS
ncbi:MAG: RNHCP domain-containing protein [Candidatus Gracilibacteria bacterium]